MKMFPVVVLLLTCAVSLRAGKELAGKIDDQKFAWQSLGTYGNHLIGISHREGDGSAELHETQTDIMIVDTGAATLIVGGTMVAPKTVKPHEVRGSSIEGGRRSNWVRETLCTFQPRYRTS